MDNSIQQSVMALPGLHNLLAHCGALEEQWLDEGGSSSC